jgi:hypothetical protein
MQQRGWKKYGIGAAGMLVLVAVIVLASGGGSAVAAQITSVFVTNDAAHAVPVREQGTARVASADATEVLADVTLTGAFQETGWISVASAKQIRLSLRCDTANEPSIFLYTKTNAPNSEIAFDEISGSDFGCGGVSRAWETPGLYVKVVLEIFDTSQSNRIIIVGRNN